MTGNHPLSNVSLSRRDFLRTSVALAAGGGSACVPAIAQDATARASIAPLLEFLKAARTADEAIRKTIPRPRRYFNSPSTKPASHALPFIQEIAAKAAALLAEHPAAADVMEGFFAARQSYKHDTIVCYAELVLAHPGHFGRDARQAAYRVRHQAGRISDDAFRSHCNTIGYAVQYADKTEPVLAQAHDSMLQKVIQLGREKDQRCIAFMEQMGLSNIRPAGTSMPLPGGVQLGYQPCSPAENFVHYPNFYIQHLPLRDISLLQDAARLLQLLQARYPSLNPALRPRTDAVDIDTDSVEFPEAQKAPGRPSQPSLEPDSLTAEEFVHHFADHPSIIAALGSGTHVQKLALAHGVSLHGVMR